MRFTTSQYLEKETVTVSVHNLNASKAFLDGQVVFAISWDQLNTNNAANPPTSLLNSLGVDAMSANDAAGSTTNPCAFALGIVKVNANTGNANVSTIQIPVGGVGEAVAYGFTDAIVQVRTRATSTDVWATTNGAAGDQLIPETVNNALKWQGTVPLSGPNPQFALGQSIIAATISYNSTNNPNAPGTLTVETARLKVRVCCM